MMEQEHTGYSAYRNRRKGYLLILALLLLVAIVIAAGIGAVTIPATEVLSILTKQIFYTIKQAPRTGVEDIHRTIILDVRLPRIFLAALVGGSLSGAGAALQGLFGNPLADPYIMGISSGAGLGATIAILCNLPSFFPGLSSVPVVAFIASIVTMIVVYFLAGARGRVPMNTFLLSGVVVSSFLWAVISFAMMVSGDSLRAIIMWLMGSLSNKGYTHVKIAVPYIVLGIAILFIRARDLNLICLGDDEARYLGIDSESTKRIIIFASSLVTAASVSVGGIIGFVGLIVPHIMRMILGPDHRLLLPASVIAGGIFLVSADTIARTLIPPAEIPVGIITALAGAPFFFFILKRYKVQRADL
ncbi:MAG: iron chelate uptake ABC transporter family permease subunit [Firmicutes bacterium]|nr:iron chelate uptake ABC transporter family permease subunit [Bacillota bacterium]